MSQPAVAPAATHALPDVNAETYPYGLVQTLLDQTADFSLFAVPEPGYAETAWLAREPDDYFGLVGGYGLAIGCALRRFEAVVQPVSGTEGLAVQQTVGDAEGRLRCRWLFGPEGFPWAPGGEPPPAIFDPWSPQRFAMTDAVFTFGDGEHGFRGYGVGRTFPAAAGGRPVTLAGAVGNVVEGFGRFQGLAGTFVMTGRLTPDLGFLGNLTCRIVDPEGRIRGQADLPSLTPVDPPDSGSTFLVLRGEKKDRNVKTTYGPPPDDRRVSLITPSQMRAVLARSSSRGSRGPRTERRIHQIAGEMVADVAFDLLAPPGTAERPVPFTTQEEYTFTDGAGRTVGTVRAGVVEGISFDLKFPSAPGQPGVRFSGFGPISGGTGAFAGARGMLTVNSLIGIAPHALSLLHVLNVLDPESKLQAGRPGSGRHRERPEAVGVLSEDDPYRPLKRSMDEHTDVYLRWRRGFARCSRPLAGAVARQLNDLLGVGDFPGLRIDPAKLAEAFENGTKPSKYDPVAFDRYLGRAKGTFRTYGVDTGREESSFVLHSTWSRENLRFADGRIAKKISGSLSRYVDPHGLPPLERGEVDPILNAWRQDVGVTSWVEIHQGERRQRTSIAYKLPGPHEVLWFVKDLSRDGRPLDDKVFMASHEWKGTFRGKTCFFMVAVFFEIDFDTCDIRRSEDRFWRALYEEE
jgi:hypothetical protein